MAFEAVEKIKQAEKDAAAIKAKAHADAKKIAAQAVQKAASRADDIEKEADAEAERIKKNADAESALILRKSALAQRKESEEFQEKARTRVTEAVKYAVKKITGLPE